MRFRLPCLVFAAVLLQACATTPAARDVTQPTTTRPAAKTSADPTSDRQRWLDMFARGYFPGRSGQVFFVPHRGDFLTDKDPLYGFMHGSPWDYDTRIPLLFFGPGFVTRGAWDMPVAQQDVAPTLASWLGVPPPATTVGKVLKEAVTAGSDRPRVIALFVLDGMRADYFDRYANLMPTLTRMRKEGAWFSNARTTALPTSTSIGHATLGTGTDPRVHGLVVNRLYNRVSGASQESYNQLDPGELMALTLADLWNLHTDGRAVIIGQGGAIRATAGLLGRGACVVNGRKVLAASYTTRDGGWETNPECYAMSKILTSFNGARYWKEAGGSWMGHDISNPGRFRASSVFQRFEGDALAAVLGHEPIGVDAVTDLVFVNFKGPDYVSHAYGPDSPELKETLGELDKQIARALDVIEKKAGPNRSVVAITADHGMPGEPAGGRRRIQPREVEEALNARFARGGPPVVQFFGDPANAQIHLDSARLAQSGVSLKEVAAFLEKQFFLAAFTEDEVRAASARLPLGQ